MAEESTNKPARRTERIGKYEIVGHLATGGMGVIYKAQDVDLDRFVALKVLPADFAAQQTTLIRFYREAKAAARLRHENIVAIFDVGESNGIHFIALEFIEGTDLQDYINRKCRLDPEEARQIMMQATQALVHAHEHGIVHRDIKPSNFLLMHKDNRLVVKLTDFGLAIRHENEAEFRITKAKTTVGTVDYMSPEQARDSRNVDIRSDIYSLGCTFYHMLAGLAPFARGTLPERIIQHMTIAPPDVRKLNKDVPAAIVSIIERMLAKKPADRYQTPADLLHDLEHPDQVTAPRKRPPAPARLERSQTRKRPIDPTLVLEKKELEPEPEAESVPRRRAEEANGRKRNSKPDTDEQPVNESIQDDEPAPRTARPPLPVPSESDLPAAEVSRKKSPKESKAWMFVAGGAAAILGFVLIATLIFSGRTPPAKKDPDAPPPKSPIASGPEVKPQVPLPVVIDTAPSKMTVVPLPLPVMDTPLEKADRDALRSEFYGPFKEFPQPPKGAAVVRMSRFDKSVRTLAEAFAQTKADAYTIIEIHDNGPIFVPSLPPLSQRSVLVRGADGYRPLIVWEDSRNAAEPKAVTTFCTVAQGKLTLENLDIVLQWSAKMPGAIFDLPDTDFHARDCTFSIGGKPPADSAGIALVRRVGSERKTQTWFKQCYARGADMALLRQQAASGAFLIDESLIVGHQQPLLEFRSREQDGLEVYCVRSSLVTAQTLLLCQPHVGKGLRPTLAVRVLDSILSRDDSSTAQGDLVHCAEGVEISNVRWRAVNCVYAGWKKLLSSGAKSISGGDLAGWHDHWFYRDGDRALIESWPSNPPSGLEEQSADTFLPALSPVAFAALTADGSIGCSIGRLPPAPPAWLERTFEPRAVPIIPTVVGPPPVINMGADLYHGEFLDLNKVPDLGAYLNDKLQKDRPAPRVVLRLFGSGAKQTSPLRIKGVENLVLHFEPSKDPLTLEARPGAALGRAPLIDMTGGHLELIGARLRLSPVTLVPTIIQVKDGSLSLTRCNLQGPHVKSTDAFESLITIVNHDATPTTLLLRDNALIARGTLIHLGDHVQLKARNNVFLATADCVRFEVNSPSVAMQHLLDHNTFAARESFFTVKTGPQFEAVEPVSIHANSNAFLHPFVEGGDKAVFLRGAEAWAGRGRWAWQGRHNVFDPRMHFYLAGFEKGTGHKQLLSIWQSTWGQVGEQEPMLLAGPALKSYITPEGKSQADVLTQLDKLALPNELRGDPNQARPGADLIYLGIKKKGP